LFVSLNAHVPIKKKMFFLTWGTQNRFA
jgi:hypothetical protein